MKKIIALFLLCVSLFGLFSCRKNKDAEYEPVPSTAEEATTVITMRIGNSTYNVRYELYRALFLNYKSTVDGGDPSVWSGENKAEYVAKIDKMILDRATEIYAAFEVCKNIGFDVYSDDVDDQIREYVRISVEGGIYGNSQIQGCGSYDAYLEALKTANLNYSVQELLFRYAIAMEYIDRYYIGTVDPNDITLNMNIGAIKYTKEDVFEFYDSDECARVLRAKLPKIVSSSPKEAAEKLKGKLEAAADSATSLKEKEYQVYVAIAHSGRFPDTGELETGYTLGKYSEERSYYGALTDAVFSIDIGEVSDCIEVVTEYEDCYYVVYKTEKSYEHFEENYESIKYVYLANCVGQIVYSAADTLKASAEYTQFLLNINHSEISM